MKKNTGFHWKFYLHGSWLGILSSLVGSVAFYIIDMIILTIPESGFNITHLQYLVQHISNIKYVLWIIGLIFFLTSLPALFGGFLLAILQQADYRRGKLSTRRGMLAGGIFGIIAALCVSCAILGFLVFYAHRMPALSAAAIHVGCAIFTAMLAGMWTGRRLVLHLQKLVESETIH